jgi:hypothetical protein
LSEVEIGGVQGGTATLGGTKSGRSPWIFGERVGVAIKSDRNL